MQPLPLGRRTFLSAFLLVALARKARALVPRRETGARRWIEGQQAIAEALASGRLSGLAWARAVERLAAEIDVAELIALIHRSRLEAAPAGGTNDPAKRFVRFLDAEGRPRRLAYGAALFDFAPADVITPHGHRHMVSAHLVMAGAVRIRNFDRLGDAPGAMRLRPTRDYVARRGHVSTMCAERDNVHWFVPQGGPAATFDIIVSGLDGGAPDHLVEAVDPLHARREADGTIIAPIIGFAEASHLYTADL